MDLITIIVVLIILGLCLLRLITRKDKSGV